MNYQLMNIITLAFLADISDIREHMPGFLEVGCSTD
jgi:hypothetical protein